MGWNCEPLLNRDFRSPVHTLKCVTGRAQIHRLSSRLPAMYNFRMFAGLEEVEGQLPKDMSARLVHRPIVVSPERSSGRRLSAELGSGSALRV